MSTKDFIKKSVLNAFTQYDAPKLAVALLAAHRTLDMHASEGVQLFLALAVLALLGSVMTASAQELTEALPPEAQELLKRYESFLEYALPLYVKEGKSQLTIAVGCTGGKHRSITFARKIAEYCDALGYRPGVQHRDAVR